ncbi:helix-turn-helix domain-containing protein [Actinomycetes bacterium KLBMP 9797]
MARAVDQDTRGIIHPAAGFERFTLTRHPPAPDLAWAVDRYWVVRWDLPDGESYEQRILPHPATHLVFEAGTAAIQAISPHDFVAQLTGRGQVFGVKFRPASFRPFLGGPVSTIAGQRLAAAPVLSAASGPGAASNAASDVDEIARVVAAAGDVNACVPAVEAFLRALGVQPLPMTASLNSVVDLIVTDRSVIQVGDLARRLGVNMRKLQRLFADHIGLGPKWVIGRCRVHEAAEAAAGGAAVDWADLAAQLGYSDQSHLIRDFTAAVGTPPDRYSRSTHP